MEETNDTSPWVDCQCGIPEGWAVIGPGALVCHHSKPSELQEIHDNLGIAILEMGIGPDVEDFFTRTPEEQVLTWLDTLMTREHQAALNDIERKIVIAKYLNKYAAVMMNMSIHMFLEAQTEARELFPEGVYDPSQA